MDSENLYQLLRRHLDRMPIGFPASESGVEIRILKQLFTPAEAEVALALSALPEPAATIHKRLGSAMTLEQLKALLEEMDRHGILLRTGADEKPRYSKLMFVLGMYERQLRRLTPQLERDCRQYMRESFAESLHTKGTTQMRVVPVNKPVAAKRTVASYDDIRTHVESFAGPFAKMDCICRHGKDLMGEKCQQTDLRENCLTLGFAATWVVARLGATPISKAEMLELLEEADHQGLVLQTENTRKPLFVCCCCHCCCGVLTSVQRFSRPSEYFSSNFTAKVDADACESCGTCAPRCQMDAISMNGKSEVEEGRCIGCGLCVTTCPTGAMRLEQRGSERVPPEETQALYAQILAERYGKWGMLKLGARKALGLKI